MQLLILLYDKDRYGIVRRHDATGPYWPVRNFSRFPDTQIYLISKSKDPIRSDGGLRIIPDTAFDDCPAQLDVLFVPGGPGIAAVIKDKKYLDFINSRGNKAKYITAVCTGSIVLAACGLLDGFKATTHWLSLDLLRRFNIETKNDRVVVDRNRITGGGVTSGIDFGLTLASILLGEEKAKEIQLMIEYNPEPPFHCGHPNVADSSVLNKVLEDRKEFQRKRTEHIDEFIRNRKNVS